MVAIVYQLFCLAAIVAASFWVMIAGWGLEVHSWPALIGGWLLIVLFGALSKLATEG